MHQVWNDAGIAVHKLAKLYKELADTDRAAQFYTFHLKRLDEEQSQGQDVAEALEFLATWNKVMPGSHLQQGVVRICVACDFVAHACSSLKSNDGAAYVGLPLWQLLGSAPIVPRFPTLCQPPAALSIIPILSAQTSPCKDAAQDIGVYDEAEALTARLMDFGGPHRDAAKGLMREIRTARLAKLGATEILGM